MAEHLSLSQASSVFVAGHRGLVGSAIGRRLEALGCRTVLVRSHSELDLCEQEAVDRFFRFSRKKRSTASCSHRSSSEWLRTSTVRQPNASSRRPIADPTSPRCPATNTLEACDNDRCSAMDPASRIDLVPRLQQSLLLACQFQVGLYHGANQFFETDFGLPSECLPRLRCISLKEVDLGRAEVTGIRFDASFPLDPGI